MLGLRMRNLVPINQIIIYRHLSDLNVSDDFTNSLSKLGIKLADFDFIQTLLFLLQSQKENEIKDNFPHHNRKEYIRTPRRSEENVWLVKGLNDIKSQTLFLFLSLPLSLVTRAHTI